MNDSNQAKILLVEDSATDAELTLRALAKSNLANEVFRVKDGAEALAFIFGTGHYSATGPAKDLYVVLLDLKLPKVDGIEVLRRIRDDERTKTLPVVIVTSSQETSDLNECYKLGANSYIVKPIEVDKFIKSISEAGLYWMLVNQHRARE